MKLIVLDGVDGVGKSFIATELVKKLNSLHINARLAKFPNADYQSGAAIYNILTHTEEGFSKYNPFATWMMYAMNRYEYFNSHKGELNDVILVADRYTTTSAVYQAQLIKTSPYSDYFDFSAHDDGNHFDTFCKSFKLLEKDEPFNDFYTDLFGSSYLRAIYFMMFFEYNILYIPAPDIVFTIDASEENIKEVISQRDYDAFEQDGSRSLRGYIYDFLGRKFDWKHLYNTFSPNAENEVNSIIDILTKTKGFEFIKYLEE